MINLISGVSLNGFIGKNGKIPWNYPEDMKYFRKMTTNSTILMGRLTFESMGSKPLPKRNNIVISSKHIDAAGINQFTSIQKAIEAYSKPIINILNGQYDDPAPIWIIGGKEIYRQCIEQQLANELHITLIPDNVQAENANDDLTEFPWINPSLYSLKEIKPLPSETETKLKLAIYTKLTT